MANDTFRIVFKPGPTERTLKRAMAALKSRVRKLERQRAKGR